jgi:hypothetical protein
VNGVGGGRFSPNAYITREQGLAIIARTVALATAQDLSNLYTPGQLSAWLGAFPDSGTISPSLRNAVVFAANLGVVDSSGGALSPRSWLTRIEAAVFLIRAGAPSVASVSPGQGAAAGGNTVTITGTGFADATSVKFGTADAQSFSVVSDTQMTAVVPEGTTGQTVNVVVRNLEGSSAIWIVTYTYTYDAPAIMSVSPASGSPNGGNTAIITGTGFGAVTAVQFGGTDAASYTVVSDTRIAAVVPAGPAGQTVNVTVVGPGGTNVVDSNVCSYTYMCPAVTSISPDHGVPSGGNTVTINGIGFANLTGSDAIRFGSTYATSYTVVSDTKITAVVPAGTAGVPVLVNVAGQVSAWEVHYTYDDISVTSVSPDHGPTVGGNTVTITGSGLSDVAVVYFGALPCPSCSVVSDTKITATVPASAGGPQQVTVSVRSFSGHTSSWSGKYEYVDVPTVASLSPSVGSKDSLVTITGTGFTDVIAVFFGSKQATIQLPYTYYAIKVTAPEGAPGAKVNVVVVTSKGASTDAIYFTYN